MANNMDVLAQLQTAVAAATNPQRKGQAQMMNLDNLSGVIRDVGGIVDTAKGARMELQAEKKLPSTISAVQEPGYKHAAYFKQISPYGKLYDPTTVRKVAHDFAVEYLWMLCESGKTDDIQQYAQEFCGVDVGFSLDFGEQPQSKAEIQKLFMTAMTADVRAQHEVNMIMLDIDSKARLKYLEHQYGIIDTMVGQQEALVSSLNDWSTYMDAQAEEYAQLYDRLSAATATYRRKDVFDTKDLTSLDKWNSWNTVVFWILVVIMVLMVMVNYFQTFASLARSVETQVKHSASQALDAIRQPSQ
jgi:hypothetical protein